METAQKVNNVGKRIRYNPFKTVDKHYFGGFFNLAENNIQEVFEEINLRLKNKNAPIKNIIEKYTDENISLVEYEKFIAILSEYFPIAKEIDQKNKKTFNDKIIEKTRIERVSDFRKDFFLFIKAIEKLRSYYTHFKHDDIIIDNQLFNLLDNILLNTVLETKKKYLKTDKTKELLKDSLQEELEKLYELKINQLEEKKREVNALIAEQKKNGEETQRPFRYSTDKDQIINSIYNDAIKPFLYENANKVEISNKKKTAFNEKDELVKEGDFNLPISSSGIVFLLSCFLNRKEIEDLKANIKGYKGKVIKGDVLDLEKNSIRFMATHRIYSVMCYKGLKNKIRTSQSTTKETLLMQMIDELSKILDVLYKNISEDLQNTFTEDWNEYYKDNFENLDNLENSKVIHPVIRKRYEDKFNYFAIRFLDEFVDFPSLRFQVHLGNYIKHSMSKNVGNVITTREIKNKIFVFGRLDEINQYKSDFFNKIKENEEETNWELFPNPNYHFPMENSDELKYANKIGIYLDLWKSKEIINDEIENKNKQTSSYKKDLVHQITKEKKRYILGNQ
ncbi:MAG: hypothetical protein HC854_16380 [Flavobacterium sp.]|nr:hypothetical protein [Flavobacterium sp.]